MKEDVHEPPRGVSLTPEPGLPRVVFHQQDWIPGYAAFLPDETTPGDPPTEHCVVNLGAFLADVEAGVYPRSEMPYLIAESMMHELIHVLEKWARVEFSEERVEALLTKYRAKYGEGFGGD